MRKRLLAEGRAPIAKAFSEGKDDAPRWEKATTLFVENMARLW